MRRRALLAATGLATAQLFIEACAPGAREPASPTPAPETSEGGIGGPAAGELRWTGSGKTVHGTWTTDVVASPAAWRPGIAVRVRATLALTDDHFAQLDRHMRIDGCVALLTAERTFDADGRLRLPSDERMSTLLTVTSLPIEGGRQGAVSRLVGHSFRTPVDELVTVPVSAVRAAGGMREVTFERTLDLPADLPPGLYRLRIDYGARSERREVNLAGEAFAERGFSDTVSECYSPPIEASATHVSGRAVDASRIVARVPWVLLAAYNSNGYRGVVADEDRPFFGISGRHIIQDDVILPRSDEADPRAVRAYSLEPAILTDTIHSPQNIPWDPTAGELRVEVTQPDGKVVDLGTSAFVARIAAGLTTKDAKLTQWKPPLYGRYVVRAAGWMRDAWGRRYEGGGTYRFWIAKRMTLATATFQGQSYPVGDRYGRDMGFAPAVPAEVEVTATLYPDSDRTRARTITYGGRASAGGLFGAAQGMKALPLDAPGEYEATVLARYTDADGHLWVSTMRHAGVVYAPDAPIVAHGKKVRAGDQLVARGSTKREGSSDPATGEQRLEHLNFPYEAGDVLLIAADGQGANKIEPVITYERKGETAAYPTRLQGVGATNLGLRTSNGLSPHLFPEYITERSYYYAAAARPGFMGRFLVAEDGARAPYRPTTRTDFGGQINASPNGDSPGTIYRLLGGAVVLARGRTPEYAGYLASAFVLPKGSNDNRVIAAGSEDLVGSTGKRSRIFLAMNARPGMVYEAGTAFAPAFQIDPPLPAKMRFTLRYPDGRSVVASGTGSTAGMWAGSERWTLDVAGAYRYSVDCEWNGHRGIVPGIPEEGGAIYVIEKERPAGTPRIAFDLPPLSSFDAAKGTTFRGTTTAAQIDYAMISPGAVLAQGILPVKDGRFAFTFDPAKVHALAPSYDIRNTLTGKPEISDVIHLTFFSKETLPVPHHCFVRLILRGNRVHYTR